MGVAQPAGDRSLLPFRHPSVRAVGVVVLAFVLAGLTGALSSTSFIGADVEQIAWVTDLLVPLRISDVVAFWLRRIMGFVVAAAVGWVTLRGIAYSYRRRGLPDQLLLVGGVWAFLAADYAVPLVFEGMVWPVAGVAAFAVFLAHRGATWCIVHLPRRPRLLMLRVFALGSAASASNGCSSRIPARSNACARSRRRDRLGRFRVQEFLWFEVTWSPTVRTLLDATDLVLMDARGFGPGNDGARHELTELARHRMHVG